MSVEDRIGTSGSTTLADLLPSYLGSWSGRLREGRFGALVSSIYPHLVREPISWQALNELRINE